MKTEITTDAQAWVKFPRLQRYFNKLDVALMQGIKAFPATVPPPHGGDFIIRPAYNLDGMSKGAEKVYMNKGQNTDFMEPGTFYQPYLGGDITCVDYFLDKDWIWKIKLVSTGIRGHDGVTFDYWDYQEIKDPRVTTPDPVLFRDLLGQVNLEAITREDGLKHICAEFIENVVIDIHFRPNPDYRSGVKAAFVVPQHRRNYWSDTEWTFREDQDGTRFGFVEGRMPEDQG